MLEKPIARGFRTFTLPDNFTKNLWNLFQLPPSTSNLKSIANDVLKMSDFYIDHPNSLTPWDEVWCQRAQAFYFLPLNFVRNQAVFQEGVRFGFFEGLKTAVDVGSGLGAVSLASGQLPLSWQGLEISKVAQNLSSKFGSSLKFMDKISKTDLVSFSYSLTEDFDLGEILDLTDNLLITEPALRTDSRKVQTLRNNLIEKGWNIWAPCTHQEACPLLKNELDWCHDRIHFKAPAWFLELESFLPMKNANLAHSYLLASKRPAPRITKAARTVGDFIPEKGKSKISVCRSSEKEVLTWLHRHLEPEEISRGALVEIPEDQVQKNQEIRISQDLKIFL